MKARGSPAAHFQKEIVMMSTSPSPPELLHGQRASTNRATAIRLSFDQFGDALGAGREYRSAHGPTRLGYCPGHKDHHRSLGITASASGRTLFKCWAGCTQKEVIDALVALGLWGPGGSRSTTAHRQTTHERLLAELSSQPVPEPPPECCRAGHCDHWDEFDRQFLLAHMRGNLEAAIAEIIALYQAARLPLSLDDLIRELRLAAELGAIVPLGISADFANWAIQNMALTAVA
jgi:hypothetical protein